MSERNIDADLKAAAQSQVFKYVVLVDLAFPSGNVRVHNSVGTYSFGGNDYLGVGAFGSIDVIAESNNLVDSPIKLSLSSVTDEIIEALRNDDIYGRDADIYLCALDEDNQLKGTPTNWVSGYMEKKELIVGQDSGVAITIQTRAARLKQRNNKRYTIEAHQVDYPEDMFFQFLPYVIGAEIPWGGSEIVRWGITNGQGLTGSSPDAIPALFKKMIGG